MQEDNQKGFRLRCPECQALLRIRDLSHVPASFPCADCGELLEVQLPTEEDAGEGSVDPARPKDDSVERVILRRARSSAGQLPPAVVGKGASGSARTRQRSARRAAGAGSQPEDLKTGFSFTSLKLHLRTARQRFPIPVPSARWLSWFVAASLLCGLLLLYLPRKETTPPDGTGTDVEQAGELAQENRLLDDARRKPGQPADVPGHPGNPADAGQNVPAGPDDLSEVPPADIAVAGGEPVPPGEQQEQPPDGLPPAGEEPAAGRPMPQLARRAPVVAPQPELPVVPPLDVAAQLAVRLRSYRTAAPVPVRQLLLELEELAGVPFQLQEDDKTPAGWQERTVMIDTGDVTVGELLAAVAERAGLTVQTGKASIQISPRQLLKPGENPGNRPASGMPP